MSRNYYAEINLHIVWQAGYGVVTFGTGDLEWVKAYVREQPQPHAARRIEERLERIATQETAEAERREGP